MQRRAAIERQLDLLDACVERNFPDLREHELATTPDPLGLGGGR